MQFIFLCTILLLQISILFALQLPTWTAPLPDPKKPLGGYARIPNTTNIEIFHGTNPNSTDYIQGAYNHAAMIDYFNGTFIILWKNCQKDEDCNGQRILYSQSINGKNWTLPNVMFPNITLPNSPIAMFVGPPIHINGREYVGATPGIWNDSSDQSAQGAQFCLWPEPINPRNCGPPGQQGITGQTNNTLMMREIKPGLGNLGPIFWASNIAPTQFSKQTKTFKIPTLNEMDTETQKNINSLNKEMKGFCQNEDSGTLKCEVCPNGCQLYNSIDPDIEIGNERSHYILPAHDMDVILYRDSNHTSAILYTSIRNITNASKDNFISGNWTYPQATNIPNDISNINCGYLPDKRIYLLSNPVKPINQTHPTGRDPLTITTSKDGIIFDKIGVVMTCTDLSKTSTCHARYQGESKNPGPSYPQGVTVVDPAPIELQGIYVVATNNKEDVWLTYMKYDTF
eukprot:93132_1